MLPMPINIKTIRDELAGGGRRESGLLNREPHESISDPFCCPDAFKGGFDECWAVSSEIIQGLQEENMRLKQYVRGCRD